MQIYEILIVDDGSKDKTLDVAQSFKNNLPIKIIKINMPQAKNGSPAKKPLVLKSFWPLVAIFVVAVIAVGSFYIFGEGLNAIQIGGLVLALVSIAVLSMG